MVVGVIVASALSGALGAALIAIIHRALTGSAAGTLTIALAFLAAVLAKAATQYAAQVLLVRFAQGVILNLCRNLCERVLVAPLERLEALGASRVLATLNDDVAVLSAAVQSLPSLATNLAVLVGCSLYLAWLSWPVFLLCILMVIIGAIGFRLLLKHAHIAIQAARDGRDRLFGNFRTLIEGIKELKLHRARREDFVRREIDETTELLRQRNIAAISQYMVADVWSQILFFALIGMLLFGAPTLTTMPAATLTGFVFATLYMMAPVWSVIGAVPTFMRGRVSLDKIRELGTTLETIAREPRGQADPIASRDKTYIALEGVTYTYPAPTPDDPGFRLGPIDLTLTSAEVVFVTGGNGSGKSTLVRLLTGLYAPHAGQIRLNGEVIEEANRERYRQLFTVVFADFHLFDRLFGLEAHGRGPEIARYLELLGMDRKVRLEQDRFSTTALSSGQRRRLALLTAYLEDRDLYVFDEWAADQDPAYKEIFYLRLLPELRARGKCVVVITHDDRYFRHGDRVLKLEAGRIVDEHRNPAPALDAQEVARRNTPSEPRSIPAKSPS